MIGRKKFTPGPWVTGPTDDTTVTRLGADGCRYEVAAIAGDYDDRDTWPVMEANARLIAAAPDLYAAVKYADQRAVSREAYPHACIEDRKLRDLIDAALAKVEAA